VKESTVDFCPVPIEQQPINEYEQLKDSWLYRWAALEEMEYWRKLGWVWLWGWPLAGSIAAASFSPVKHPLKFALCGAAGAGLLVVFVILQLYLGWSYVGDRLKQEKISYEESGWYDGQTWLKPTPIVNRDRLIVSYKVEPILARLKKTALILLGAFGIDALTWLVL
jgi:hypothetical protein